MVILLEEKVKCLLVKPNEEPKVIEIPNTLESFQNVVGGLIEVVRLSETVYLVCNEEGKLLNLPFNREIFSGKDYIAGDFIICAFDKNEDPTSLDKEELIFWKNYYKL